MTTQAAAVAPAPANGGASMAVTVKHEASPQPDGKSGTPAAAAAATPAAGSRGSTPAADGAAEAAAGAGAGAADAAPSKEDEEQRKLEDEILAEGQAIAGVRALLAKAFRCVHVGGGPGARGRRRRQHGRKAPRGGRLEGWLCHSAAVAGAAAHCPAAVAPAPARLELSLPRALPLRCPPLAAHCPGWVPLPRLACSRPWEEPAAPRGHWGFLLQEAQWLANDMAQVGAGLWSVGAGLWSVGAGLWSVGAGLVGARRVRRRGHPRALRGSCWSCCQAALQPLQPLQPLRCSCAARPAPVPACAAQLPGTPALARASTAAALPFPSPCCACLPPGTAVEAGGGAGRRLGGGPPARQIRAQAASRGAAALPRRNRGAARRGGQGGGGSRKGGRPAGRCVRWRVVVVVGGGGVVVVGGVCGGVGWGGDACSGEEQLAAGRAGNVLACERQGLPACSSALPPRPRAALFSCPAAKSASAAAVAEPPAAAALKLDPADDPIFKELTGHELALPGTPPNE